MSSQFTPGKNIVHFDSEGQKVAAHLYLPDDYSTGKTYPAVTVTPPVTGVKEQTGTDYAKAFSKRGFAALVFDPRGWGESEGTPGYLIPEWFVRDVRNAVDFLRTLDVTDVNNVFNSGICMGSGWAMYETAFDTRINAVAMISPYLIELDTPLSMLGAEGYRNMVVKALTDAAQARFDSGEEVYIKPVPETEEEIAAAPEPYLCRDERLLFARSARRHAHMEEPGGRQQSILALWLLDLQLHQAVRADPDLPCLWCRSCLEPGRKALCRGGQSREGFSDRRGRPLRSILAARACREDL